MITLTISLNPNETNAEVLAQVVRLLAGIEANRQPAYSSEVIGDGGVVVETEKVKKPRKKRVMTDEQKAAFRERMIAGRKAKEAEKKASESKSAKPKKENGSTKLSIPDSKAPIPRTGKKVEAKPAAQ